MNLRKYRKKWKNLGNKYVALENKNKFIFKKTTRKVGSGETKKSPFTHQITQAFFPPYMLHTLLNTFLKLLRYSKYWKKKKKNKKAFSSVLTELYWVLVSTQQTGTAWIWGEGEKFTDVLKRWKQQFERRSSTGGRGIFRDRKISSLQKKREVVSKTLLFNTVLRRWIQMSLDPEQEGRQRKLSLKNIHRGANYDLFW